MLSTIAEHVSRFLETNEDSENGTKEPRDDRKSDGDVDEARAPNLRTLIHRLFPSVSSNDEDSAPDRLWQVGTRQRRRAVSATTSPRGNKLSFDNGIAAGSSSSTGQRRQLHAGATQPKSASSETTLNGLRMSLSSWFETPSPEFPHKKATHKKQSEANYLGSLEFTTFYQSYESSFAVTIIRANHLPKMDLMGLTDPFVKCSLLPDRKRKLETKIRRKTLNPEWNEKLLFEGLSVEKLQQRVLFLQVYDHDRFSRNDPVGDILLPLHTLLPDEETLHTCNLVPAEGSNKRGELQLSLCYQPLEGILDVEVVKAKNLKPMDINGSSDPYVKIWLISRGRKMEKRKTIVIKNTLNPTFEEEFTFAAPMERLREIQLEVTVMDHDRIGRNETIGKIYLGHRSAGLEKQHWRDMLTSARKPVSQWHVLKV